MIIAHNTFTSRTPKQWWLWPVAFAARCQSRSYQELYEDSHVDGFDVRLWWDDSGELEFRHNAFAYHADDIHSFLKYCNERGLTIRLFFECRTKKMAKDASERGLENKFVRTCIDWQKWYPNVRFFGGRNVMTWKVLYDFGWEPDAEEYISSTQALFKWEPAWLNRLDNLWPWLYAKLHNRENLKKATATEKAYLYDFL